MDTCTPTSNAAVPGALGRFRPDRSAAPSHRGMCYFPLEHLVFSEGLASQNFSPPVWEESGGLKSGQPL